MARAYRSDPRVRYAVREKIDLASLDRECVAELDRKVVALARFAKVVRDRETLPKREG